MPTHPRPESHACTRTQPRGGGAAPGVCHDAGERTRHTSAGGGAQDTTPHLGWPRRRCCDACRRPLAGSAHVHVCVRLIRAASRTRARTAGPGCRAVPRTVPRTGGSCCCAGCGACVHDAREKLGACLLRLLLHGGTQPTPATNARVSSRPGTRTRRPSAQRSCSQPPLVPSMHSLATQTRHPPLPRDYAQPQRASTRHSPRPHARDRSRDWRR